MISRDIVRLGENSSHVPAGDHIAGFFRPFPSRASHGRKALCRRKVLFHLTLQTCYRRRIVRHDWDVKKRGDRRQRGNRIKKRNQLSAKSFGFLGSCLYFLDRPSSVSYECFLLALTKVGMRRYI